MKVLFYMARYPGVGGIENVTSCIAERMVSDGIKVCILSHQQQENLSPIPSVQVFSMPDAQNFYTKRNCDYAKALLLGHNFDAIVFQDCYAPMERIICPVVRMLNIPLYIFEHNTPLCVKLKKTLEPSLSIKGIIRRILYPYLLHKEISRKKYLLDYSTRYVLLSRRYVNEFCDLLSIPRTDARVSYINNPTVYTDTIEDITKENILLCVCRMAPEKQVDKILLVWERISNQLPDWKLVVVGDGPQKTEIEQLIKKRKLPRVVLTGFKNPIPFYQKSKIFLMMSKFEGWPMTLVESMQHGCVPIVWNSFSSVYDIVDNRKDGLIIQNNDTMHFESAILSLANNKSYWETLSDNAKTKVSSFSIDKVYLNWKSVLGI